jgi:cyanophycinase
MNQHDQRPREGTLVIIGGHEDKEGKCTILREVAKLVGTHPLVIATVASHEPDGYFDGYKTAFGKLGVTDLHELYVEDRAETADPDKMRALRDAGGVFFSGGDQLRISSQIGDTPFETRVREIFTSGGVIAGTSAGASAMGETMLIRGASGESHHIGDLHMAPGLGLIRDVIIDQHFAERGRIGRLLGAVALNPRILGIGIDEDTAIVVRGRQFRVVGRGAVYIVEGAAVTRSDVRMHVLSEGDRFDLDRRRPIGALTVEESHALERQASQLA